MSSYVVKVPTMLSKLLLLLSVMFMPFGMSSAGASAASMDHHAMMGAAAMEHCPDQPSKPDRMDGMAMCAMACASALPAQEPAREQAPKKDHQLVVPMAERTMSGIQPEIATPPPKRA